MSPTEAVVYIPEDSDCYDGLYARRGVAHIERRAYRFGGVLRKWRHVLEKAAEGAVVVFARQEHAASVSQWAVKREFVGEETCRLIPIVQEAAVNRRSPSPCDESPTVALLDRWRAIQRRAWNTSPAERLVDDTARRWASECEQRVTRANDR